MAKLTIQITPKKKEYYDNFDRIFPNAYMGFRKPIAPPTKAFRDKSKYTRKKKHRWAE